MFRFLVSLAAMLGLLAALTSCSLTADPSIRYNWSNNSLITNGTACDLAVIDATKFDRVTVPRGTKITRGTLQDVVEVVVHKELGMAATPPDPISIVELRKRAGCALRMDRSREISLGTFGDFIMEGHGGLVVDLELILPERMEVVEGPGLHCVKATADFSGDWSVPSSPAPWLRLEDHPAPEHLRSEDPRGGDDDPREDYAPRD